MVHVPAVLSHSDSNHSSEEKFCSSRVERRVFEQPAQLRWNRFACLINSAPVVCILSILTNSEYLAVLHNIHVSDGTHANQNAQFIQMSFTMPERFSPAGDELIPFSSVRVGKGNSSSNVQDWVYPCGISTSDMPTVYGATGVSATYEALSQVTRILSTPSYSLD